MTLKLDSQFVMQREPPVSPCAVEGGKLLRTAETCLQNLAVSERLEGTRSLYFVCVQGHATTAPIHWAPPPRWRKDGPDAADKLASAAAPHRAALIAMTVSLLREERAVQFTLPVVFRR